MIWIIGIGLGVVSISWMTHALLPKSKGHWAIYPPAITLLVVVTGGLLIEAYISWLLLSAFSRHPVGSAMAVLTMHLLAILSVWRSS